MHARLAAQVTPFNDALQMPDVHRMLDLATETGRAMMDRMSPQQATMIAYLNDFKLLMLLTLATMPLLFIIRAARRAPTEEDLEEAAVLE